MLLDVKSGKEIEWKPMPIFLPWRALSGLSLSESCLNVLIQGASHPLAIARCVLCSDPKEASVSAVLFAGHHHIANVTFSDKGSKPAPCEEQSCTQLLQDCSCYHSPVWMQHSPFTTLTLTLTGRAATVTAEKVPVLLYFTQGFRII